MGDKLSFPPQKGRVHKLPTSAKNSKAVETRLSKGGLCLAGTASYDASIWEDICLEFEREHRISRQELYTIIAHNFPEWGGRYESKKPGLPPEYWVQSESILDARMGWAKFKRELDQAIRRYKPKAKMWERLWELKKHPDRGDLYETFNDPAESPFKEDHPESDINNQLYGIYSDAEEPDTDY